MAKFSSIGLAVVNVWSSSTAMCVVLVEGWVDHANPRHYRSAAMAIPAGTYRLGPDDGTLSAEDRRSGAVAKAGHDLLIHVTAWEATLEVGEDPADTRIELTADGGVAARARGHGRDADARTTTTRPTSSRPSTTRS